MQGLKIQRFCVWGLKTGTKYASIENHIWIKWSNYTIILLIFSANRGSTDLTFQLWWRLFQKYFVHTNFDIYVLLQALGWYLCWWTIIPRGYHLTSSQCFGNDIMFIRYICVWHLQYLNNVIIFKIRFSSLRHRWPWLILVILFRPFRLLSPKTLNKFWLSNLSIWTVLDEGYSRNELCALNLISTFY